MVIERVELPITPGQEHGFEEMMVEGLSILRGAPGCRSARCARGVECPSIYLLLLEWDSIAAHVAFTSTAAFARFGTLAGRFASGQSSAAHYQPIE